MKNNEPILKPIINIWLFFVKHFQKWYNLSKEGVGMGGEEKRNRILTLKWQMRNL